MKGSLNENTSTTPRHQQQQSTNEVEEIDENESNNSNTNNNNRFVPFYLRDDLPANRQSKQRNNQKRRRKTIQDVIQQLANNGISLTNTNNNPSINNNNPIKHPYNCSSSTTTSRTFHNNNANINNNNSIIHHLHSFSSSSSCNSSSTGFPITTPPLNSSSIIHTTNNTIPLHHHSSNISNNNTNNNNTILPSVVITQTSGVQERFSLAPSPSSFNINLTTPNVNNNNTTISNNNNNNTNHSNTGLTTKVRSASVFTANNNVKPTSSSSNTKFQQHQDPQNDLRALNSSAQVLNYLKNIQQQQQAFMQQNKLLQPPPDINVSVNHIKNQLLTNNTTIVSSNTYIPSYTLNPTVDMMIYNWEAKIRKEQQRQRLQKLRRPIPSLRLPPIRDDNLSSSMLDSPSSGGSQSDRTLTLRSLSSRTNGMSSRSTSPLNSPTSSTLSSSSDLMIDDEEFTLKSRLDSALVDKLPSISKLNLPPFSLPHSSSSTCPFSLSPQNNVINTENNGGNNTTSAVSGEQGGIQHFLQQQPYTSGPFINPISLNHNNNNNTTSAASTTSTTHQYTYRPEGLLTSRYHHYYHPNNNNGQQQQHFVFNGTVGNNNMYNNNKVEESTQSSIITSLISPRLTRNGGNKVHHNRTSPRSSPRNTYHPYPSPYHIDGTSGVISPRKKKKVSPPSSSSSTNNTTIIDNNNNSSTVMQEQGSSSLHNTSNDPTVAISTNNINTTSQQQPVGGIVGSISPEEQQHRMSMELFEAIFRHTPVPMYILNAKGYFTAVNQSFVSMLGFGLESEFVNKSAFGLVIAEDNREELMGQIKVFAASETNNNMMAHQHRKYQVRMKDRRGTNILSENTVYVLKDVIGSGEFYVFTVTNYAENKILL